MFASHTTRGYARAALFSVACVVLAIRAPGLDGVDGLDGVEGAERAPLLERVHVIGASASDGFGLQLEVGAPVTLADVLRRGLGDTVQVEHDSNALFSLDARRHGKRQVQKAVLDEATLVVAVDFLFWFGYGNAPSTERRYDLLEAGLSLLDRLQCPVLVGTLPDMSAAVNGRGPLGMPFIQASQVPSREARARMNRRIADWAEENAGRVMLVPLADFVATLNARKVLRVHDNTWDPAEGALLQRDLLHPTLDGTIALGLIVLETLVNARRDVAEAAVEWDSAALRKTLLEDAEKARRAREEAQREQQPKKETVR